MEFPREVLSWEGGEGVGEIVLVGRKGDRDRKWYNEEGVGGRERERERELPSDDSDPCHTVLTGLECCVCAITLHFSLFLEQYKRHTVIDNIYRVHVRHIKEKK